MRCHYLLVKIHFLVHIGPIMCLNPLATAYGQMPASLITNHATSCIILGVKLNTHENCLEPKFHEDWTIGSGIKSKKPVFGLWPFIDGLYGIAGWDMALICSSWLWLPGVFGILTIGSPGKKLKKGGSKIKCPYCSSDALYRKTNYG